MRAWLLASIVLGCSRAPVEVGPDPTPPAPSAVPTIAKNSDGSPKRLPPSAPSTPPHTLVLAYDDFGPQALAGQLLGPSWWSWEAGGSFEPGDEFDVRVVVYRGRTRAQVEATYPTVKNVSDHRLVPYADAIAFLDEALADPDLPSSLADDLRATRKRIVDALGP